MKAKLIVEGKEFPIEIQDPELQKLLVPPKKTGYERVGTGDEFWCVDYVNDIHIAHEGCNGPSFTENHLYKYANYYSDKTIAENNARADKLMRQLRRFAVERRENDNPREKYVIYYLKNPGLLQLRRDSNICFCGPWFDSQHSGAQAIEEFKDELIWYFTEYKDSL